MVFEKQSHYLRAVLHARYPLQAPSLFPTVDLLDSHAVRAIHARVRWGSDRATPYRAHCELPRRFHAAPFLPLNSVTQCDPWSAAGVPHPLSTAFDAPRLSLGARGCYPPPS